ncbi:hypothetical protein [Rhodococcus sp. UYP5]|uniref:hypothetical protein n=1 Tax=Rhodococcus sp. UYP5 TaxID=1756406 RepID=UPI00339A7B09
MLDVQVYSTRPAPILNSRTDVGGNESSDAHRVAEHLAANPGRSPQHSFSGAPTQTPPSTERNQKMMHNNVVDADRGLTESDFITVAGLILASVTIARVRRGQRSSIES